jgi:hypothetical protein
MTQNSHCDQLADRFARLEQDSLVDVKFFLAPADEATREVLCHEVNRLFAAYDTGAYDDLDFKDSYRA